MASNEASIKLNLKESLLSSSSNVMSQVAAEVEGSQRVSDDSSFAFWVKQIARFTDEKSVVFAAWENNRFVRLKLIDVVKALKDLDYFDEVERINLLPHPNFIKVEFAAVSMVEIFKDTVTHIGSHLIKFVEKDLISQMCVISVANLPPNLIEMHVLPQLKVWGRSVKLAFQFIPKKDGKMVQVGNTKIHFYFNDGFSVQDIPYFVRVLGFKIHLNIATRQRVCFRCTGVDHLVSACPYRYCGVCRGMKLVSHGCSLSYAAATVSAESSSLIPLMHDRLLEAGNVEDAALDTSRLESSANSLNDLELESDSGADSAESQVDDSAQDDSITGKALSCSGDNLIPKRMRTRSSSRNAIRKSYVKASDKVGRDKNGMQVHKKRKNKRNGGDKTRKSQKKKNDNVDDMVLDAGVKSDEADVDGGGKPEFPLSGDRLPGIATHESISSLQVSESKAAAAANV